jgi:tRNA 2-thiouridine synthesizing protein C
VGKMAEKKIGILNCSAPHGRASGRESLDLALAMSAFNESLSLFFSDDGVYQLLVRQSPGDILQKHYQPLFKMLALYDVENIYVCASSLEERGLSSEMLITDVEIVNKQQLQQQLNDQDQLLRF